MLHPVCQTSSWEFFGAPCRLRCGIKEWLLIDCFRCSPAHLCSKRQVCFVGGYVLLVGPPSVSLVSGLTIYPFLFCRLRGFSLFDQFFWIMIKRINVAVHCSVYFRPAEEGIFERQAWHLRSSYVLQMVVRELGGRLCLSTAGSHEFRPFSHWLLPLNDFRSCVSQLRLYHWLRCTFGLNRCRLIIDLRCCKLIEVGRRQNPAHRPIEGL